MQRITTAPLALVTSSTTSQASRRSSDQMLRECRLLVDLPMSPPWLARHHPCTPLLQRICTLARRSPRALMDHRSLLRIPKRVRWLKQMGPNVLILTVTPSQCPVERSIVAVSELSIMRGTWTNVWLSVTPSAVIARQRISIRPVGTASFWRMLRGLRSCRVLMPMERWLPVDRRMLRRFTPRPCPLRLA